jgi:hypothetical protein
MPLPKPPALPPKPLPEDPRNVVGWQWIKDRNGDEVLVPLPRICRCGAAVNYGKDGFWWCTFCWQQRIDTHGSRP